MSSISSGTSKYTKYFLPAILTVLFLLYAQTFFFKYIFFDDDALILSGYPRLSGIEKILPAFSDNYLEGHYYRPLTNISFILNAALSGQAPWLYHATNVLIHTLTVVILFCLLDKMGYSKIIILPVVLLFTISPMQLNAVAWIAGRADLLVGLFSLALFLLFLKFITNPELYLIPLIGLLIISAFFSKESALLIPLLMLVYFPVANKKGGSAARYFLLLSVIIALTVFYFQLRTMLYTVAAEKISVTNLAQTIRIIPETVFKFFSPVGVKVLPDFAPLLSAAGGILILFFLIIPFIQKKIDKKKYFFGFLWFIVLMIPGLFFVPNPQDKFYYWDCRSYAPSIGLVIMASELFSTLYKDLINLRTLRMIGVYLAILFCCSFYYLHLYENPLVFWNSVETGYPERYLPHVALYKYYEYRGDKENAESQFAKVIELSPDNVSNREKLCDYYIANNKPDKAFLTASEGLKYKSDETVLFKEMITSAVLMNKAELLDEYLFNTIHSPEINSRLKKILSEEAASLKNYISPQLYNGLQNRAEKIGAIVH